ncbi:hypothetical protein HY629_01010 [Candidatus Uhrbacteria bacterium]|nr:hypothetical protein [Candidatus Uhrbacteria bacterium]
MRRPPRIIRFFLDHWLFLVSVIILFFVSSSLARQLMRQYTVTSDLTRLTREAERIEEDNGRLRTLIGYAKSLPFIEREARLKKTLQKPGEEVVVVQGAAPIAATHNTETDDRSNARKWFDLFLRVQ